jgi:hypothetical protein
MTRKNDGASANPNTSTAVPPDRNSTMARGAPPRFRPVPMACGCSNLDGLGGTLNPASHKSGRTALPKTPGRHGSRKRRFASRRNPRGSRRSTSRLPAGGSNSAVQARSNRPRGARKPLKNRHSGYGREGGYYGIEEYIEVKYVLMGGFDW